jgi:hypothetical protein
MPGVLVVQRQRTHRAVTVAAATSGAVAAGAGAAASSAGNGSGSGSTGGGGNGAAGDAVGSSSHGVGLERLGKSGQLDPDARAAGSQQVRHLELILLHSYT